MTRISKTEKQERKATAIKYLRKVLRPGKVVNTVVTHTGRSGMYRHIKLVVTFKGELLNISSWVADALEWRDLGNGALGVSGCGMDMGFHTVYVLSSALYPKGFRCIGKRCPSNDHSNGDRDYTPHKHGCGGYALRQGWVEL